MSPGPQTVTNNSGTGRSSTPGVITIGASTSIGAGIGKTEGYGLAIGFDGSMAIYHNTGTRGGPSVSAGGGFNIGYSSGKGAMSIAGTGKSAGAGLGFGPDLGVGFPTDGGAGLSFSGGWGETFGIGTQVESGSTDIWMLR